LRNRYVVAHRWVSIATHNSLNQVRSFRNLVLGASAALMVLAVSLAVIGRWQPNSIPLCFPTQPTAPTATTTTGATLSMFECPTGTSTDSDDDAPSSGDVALVELLGFIGGTIAAAVAIRRVRGTATPFGVPVALAVLKMPFGALTALTAIILIRGAFLPGLSSLDSQSQIVAYALVFGYAQQVLTKLVDRQGQNVLDRVPSTGALTVPPVGTGGDESGTD
jgi:hypothetical protein